MQTKPTMKPEDYLARFPMRFAHLITITSLSGAGSSTLLNLFKQSDFCKGKPFRFASGGDMMRIKAAEAGMTMEQFATHLKKNPRLGIDRELDQMLIQFGAHDFGVYEGRMCHILPGAFRVRVDCDLETRITRRAGQLERAAAHIRREMTQRDADDESRYRALYGPACYPPDNFFDLIISSADYRPEGLYERIVRSHGLWTRQMTQGNRLVKGVVFNPDFNIDVGSVWLE